jgi:hypothetical protein
MLPLSSGRAWARNRISSTITDAIVIAFRQLRGPLRRQLLGGLADLVELETEQPAVFVDASQQQLVDGGLNGRCVNLSAGYGVTIV